MRVKRFTRKRLPAFSGQQAADLQAGSSAVRDSSAVRGSSAVRDSSVVRTSARRSKELTTFNIIMLLVVAALVFTAYISNIITVDRLSVTMTDLERREQQQLRRREALRAEINILSSYTRIQREAGALDLVHATHQPFSLAVPGLREETAQDAEGQVRQ